MNNYIVKEFELELLTPATRRSPSRLGELLADSFFEFTQSGGTATKQDIIDALPNLPEETFSVRDYTEKILCENLILVHYVADRVVLSTGEKRCTLCSSIWQKKGTSWQMIFFQGTPAKYN